MTRISADEMSLFRARSTDRHGAVDLLAVMNFPTGIRTAITGFTDDVNNQFRTVLSEGKTLAIWSELSLDARDPLDKKELPSAIAPEFVAM